MSKKYKKVCKYLNHVEHLLILTSTVTGGVSISALFAIPVGNRSSEVQIKICAITASIKKYKSIIKKNKKKHNLYLSHDGFVSVENVLREYFEMKEEITNPETSVEYTI